MFTAIYLEELKVTAKDRLLKLEQVLQSFVASPQGIDIFVAQVDPDAIGSALGTMLLIEAIFTRSPKIFYAGHIAHPQNKWVFNKYGLRKMFAPVAEYKNGEGKIHAIVDSSLAQDSRIKLALSPKIVIDHHKGSELVEDENSFFWIEEVGIGAASTLVTELLREKDYKFSPDNAYIAPLLALGIYNDTKSMMSASKRDRAAFDYLSQQFQEQELVQLIEYTYTEGYFNRLKNALNSILRKGSRMVTSVGEINENNADDLSTIADTFMRMEGITLVAVLGWLGENIRISVRNKDLGMPLDEFLKKRFPNMSGAKLAPDGRGEGGVLLTLENVQSLKILLGAEKSQEIMRDAIVKSIAELFFTD